MTRIYYKYKRGNEVESMNCSGCGQGTARGYDTSHFLDDSGCKIREAELTSDKVVIWKEYKSGWWKLWNKERRIDPERNGEKWIHFKPLYYCPQCSFSGRMPRIDSPREMLESLFISKVLQSDFSKLRDFRWSVRMNLDNH